MGQITEKNSKTGKAVFERMRKEESCFPAGGTNFFVFRFSICGNRSKKYFFSLFPSGIVHKSLFFF